MAPTTDSPNPDARKAWAALVEADRQVPFGPLFFLEHLRGLVRDRCPDPSEGLPSVHLHLLDGECLDVCHVIGISPAWIALAVNEPERPAGSALMRTEMVPYSTIGRVTIHATHREGSHHMGFDVAVQAELLGTASPRSSLSPEEALRAIASARGSGGVPETGSNDETSSTTKA